MSDEMMCLSFGQVPFSLTPRKPLLLWQSWCTREVQIAAFVTCVESGGDKTSSSCVFSCSFGSASVGGLVICEYSFDVRFSSQVGVPFLILANTSLSEGSTVFLQQWSSIRKL